MMFEFFAWALALPPLFACMIYTLEVLAGLRSVRLTFDPDFPGRAAILIPAHNEAISIGATVAKLQTAVDPSWRLLVVADNCSDGTAAAARSAGAETIERSDSKKIGKGYALAYGRDYLANDPPEVVLVIDADCWMDQPSIRRLAAAALTLQAPTQAANLLVAPPGAPPIVQISNFAMLVKNLVRARGLYRLAGTIPLFGTGMAFPWAIFETADLGTSEMVEDLRLSVDLAREGAQVHLVESASVRSQSAAAEDTLGQRRRWEHGFLRMACKEALPLLLRGAARLSYRQIGMGLHLCVPPLALLLIATSACLLVLGGASLATGVWLPAILLLSALAATLAATLLAWLTEGRDTLPLNSLVRVPLYVVQKLPIYFSLITSRHTYWNRTPRNSE